MKIAVISFPGSNCEAESLHAIRQAGMDAEEFLWNDDRHKLTGYDGYFLIGGFSYEDRSRSGIIASLDPVMNVIREEAAKGKPVLGICNGAQILVETGLVPGLKDNALGMALATNRRIQNGKVLGTGYYNAWVYMTLTAHPKQTAFTRHFAPNARLRVPVAHGEGRFIMEPALLAELRLGGLTTFRYCTEAGEISADFPTNPNGAMDNLAAVTNAAGNVMAMMPHPERSADGAPLFSSMRDYIAEEKKVTAIPLAYTPPKTAPAEYQAPENSQSLLVDMIITDNEAKTIEETLKQLHIYARVKRLVHWEIVQNDDSDPAVIKKQIIDSGELFNKNKEFIVTEPDTKVGEYVRYLLVRYKDDIFGQSKLQALGQGAGLGGIQHITRGNLWQIATNHDSIDTMVDHILDTNILCNPFSQECFTYGL